MESIVFLKDCLDVMAQFPDKYFDLAVVDPPFGLGEKITTGGTWAAKYTSNDSRWDIKPEQKYFNELFRVSKSQIIWGGNYFNLPPTRCFLIWVKIPSMETMADAELAWTSFDKNTKVFKHPRNSSEKRIHICQKPVKLYDWIFEKYAEPGFKILDTHLGSGSSRIAAYKHKLDFIGCEINPEYFEKSVKRFQNFKNQLTLF